MIDFDNISIDSTELGKLVQIWVCMVYVEKHVFYWFHIAVVFFLVVWRLSAFRGSVLVFWLICL